VFSYSTIQLFSDLLPIFKPRGLQISICYGQVQGLFPESCYSGMLIYILV